MRWLTGLLAAGLVAVAANVASAGSAGAEDGPEPPRAWVPGKAVPVVKECRLASPVATHPVLGRWTDVACSFGSATPETVQGTLLPGSYDAAGFDSLDGFRSGVVEGRWESPVTFRGVLHMDLQGDGDCPNPACIHGRAEGHSGARVELTPGVLEDLGLDTVVWIGHPGFPQQPGATAAMDYVVRISLFEVDRVPAGYSAF